MMSVCIYVYMCVSHQSNSSYILLSKYSIITINVEINSTRLEKYFPKSYLPLNIAKSGLNQNKARLCVRSNETAHPPSILYDCRNWNHYFYHLSSS